jgi:phosphoglycerol transferase
MSWKDRALAPVAYALAAVLCLALLVVVLRLWQADPGVPVRYEGDTLFALMCIQNLRDGSHLHTDRLAAPYGFDLHDFPLPESLHLAILKVLVLCTGDPFQTLNYYYGLTFLLITFSSLAVLRRFGIATLPALVCSLLYAFLPYHLWRGPAHLFLSAYYLIPPTVLVILEVYLRRLGVPWRQRSAGAAEEAGGPPAPRKDGAWRRWGLALGVCLLVSCAGVYYAFFACFFLLIAGLGAAVRARRVAAVGPAGVLIATLSIGVLVNLSPNFLYRIQHGKNPHAVQRGPGEAEFFALCLTDLVLPVDHHRSDRLANLKSRYASQSIRTATEHSFASLGSVGTVGLLVLAGGVLFQVRGLPPVLSGLGLLSVWGFLLGTLGGLGSLFAFLVTPQIRDYNRVSIYLAFFALFAVAWLLDRLLARAERYGRRGRWAMSAGCLLVLAGGIWDQTSESNVPRHAALRADFDSDRAFTGQVEQSLPAGALVFQLPYIDFPEGLEKGRMRCYDHLRLHVHSRTLRFSHAAVRGRFPAQVLADVGSCPLEQAVQRMAFMGYSGIHLDRWAYSDGGQKLEDQLRWLLQVNPLVSPNGRDAFFSLRGHVRRMKDNYTEADWARAERWWLQPTLVRKWWESFYFKEPSTHILGQWCCRRSEATLVNPLDEARRVTVRFRVRTRSQRATLEITSPLFSATLPIDTTEREFSRTVVAPPGKQTIVFTHDAGPELGFVLRDFAVVNDGPGGSP